LLALISGLQQKPPTLIYEMEGDQKETTTEVKRVLQVKTSCLGKKPQTTIFLTISI
jgi:hypothetical protein